MKKIVLFSIISLIPLIVYAQDGPTFPGVPVDGGLSLVMGAGLVYGAKKLIEKNKDR